MRVLALDLGTRRIGVAVSDAGEVLATPRSALVRSGDPAADRRRIAALVAEEEAGLVLVGLPLSLDGSEQAAAAGARAEADALSAALAPSGVAVELCDERFTTVSAHRLLAERGLDARARRTMVDSAAAAVMLQAWLDGRRPPAPHPDEPHGEP